MDFLLTLFFGAIAGALLIELLRRFLTWRGIRRARRAAAQEEAAEGTGGSRTSSYLDEDAPGTHAGQKPADEDSNDDRRSRLVDAIAAAYRKKLEERYQEPPEPPSTASPRERSEWLQACGARYCAIRDELVDFMNSRSGNSAEELDQLAAEIDQERK